MNAKALEFRETQRIEQQIIENPAIAAEWTRHQIAAEEAIFCLAAGRWPHVRGKS
ncbi:hypothetical protein [Pseudomonas oryziphila]|uniref:hypothetical protein n=1 Tax=Pseudomonas oryziphila TaxID=2894079 RepID=UPI0016807F53|nr:hypothetical protein [Pseudomonas oryziphila]